MNTTAYTPAELACFEQALEAAAEEAGASGSDIPVEQMAERLFRAAGQGLRDIDTLKAVALGKEAWPPTGKNGEGPVIDPSTLGTR